MKAARSEAGRVRGIGLGELGNCKYLRSQHIAAKVMRTSIAILSFLGVTKVFSMIITLRLRRFTSTALVLLRVVAKGVLR